MLAWQWAEKLVVSVVDRNHGRPGGHLHSRSQKASLAPTPLVIHSMSGLTSPMQKSDTSSGVIVLQRYPPSTRRMRPKPLASPRAGSFRRMYWPPQSGPSYVGGTPWPQWHPTESATIKAAAAPQCDIDMGESAAIWRWQKQHPCCWVESCEKRGVGGRLPKCVCARAG